MVLGGFRSFHVLVTASYVAVESIRVRIAFRAALFQSFGRNTHLKIFKILLPEIENDRQQR